MTTRLPAAATRNILVMHAKPIVPIGLVAAHPGPADARDVLLPAAKELTWTA